MKLAKRFGASVYASIRGFANTHYRFWVVYILEPIEFVEGASSKIALERRRVVCVGAGVDDAGLNAKFFPRAHKAYG
jgi:hypothetical protein